MKARIIKTGEEITIIGISKEWGTAQYYGSDGIYRQRTFKDKEIEFIDTTDTRQIDWEQRRYEIAKDILVASYSQIEEYDVDVTIFADISVAWADMLIEKLKKESK
jgi:hypothetical protein